MKKEIEKFDKYLKRFSDNQLNVLGEVGFILLDLIKIKPNTNIQPLIDRITAQKDFDSVDEANKFLKTYFDFHNKFINYTSTIFQAENEAKFSMQIDELVTSLLQSVSLNEQKDFMINFIDTIYREVFKEFALNIQKDHNPQKNLQNAIKAFGSEELAFLFYSLLEIADELKKSKNTTTQAKIVEICNPVFVFLLALNEQRKNKFLQTEQYQENQTSNNPFYNVGRNDPCPCGSGRKYKKCCLSQNKRKSDTISVHKTPLQAPKALTHEEVEEFYNTWTKFFEFVSKIYSEMYDIKYQKSYIKDEYGKFALSRNVIDSKLANDIRGFIAINFKKLSEEFQSTKATKKDKEMILEIALSYKFSKFYISQFYEDGSAIFFDTQTKLSYFVNNLYDPFSVMLKPFDLFETMLFSYKGKIVADGIFGMYNMQIGENVKNIFKESFQESSKNLQFTLAQNEIKHKIYQLKISINYSKPNIYRKVQLSSNTSFYTLHKIIQVLFDWDEAHLWEFITKNGNYLDKKEITNTKEFAAQKFSIEHELKNEKDKLMYIYDFGDNWEHTVILEKIIESNEELLIPKIIGGKRVAPIEDCGGIFAYNEIVQMIENPSNENNDILEELGVEPFDTAYFNVKELNKILRDSF